MTTDKPRFTIPRDLAQPISAHPQMTDESTRRIAQRFAPKPDPENVAAVEIALANERADDRLVQFSPGSSGDAPEHGGAGGPIQLSDLSEVRVSSGRHPSIQERLLSAAAEEAAVQQENTAALFSCHGELLDLISRYLPEGSRPAPDERAALSKAAFHLAEILTMPDYGRRPFMEAIKALAAGAQMAEVGFSAPMKNTITSVRNGGC